MQRDSQSTHPTLGGHATRKPSPESSLRTTLAHFFPQGIGQRLTRGVDHLCDDLGLPKSSLWGLPKS